MPLIPAPSAPEIRAKQMLNPKKNNQKKKGLAALIQAQILTNTPRSHWKLQPWQVTATNGWRSICHITFHVTEPAADTNAVIFPSCYYMWTHAATTEISVSAFRVYCHPRCVLFLSPCAYMATNWRQVRFKPMLLMGKNVWYVLAFSPFLYLAQRRSCSCSPRSVCVCSHQTPLFSPYRLPQFERAKSLR